LDILPDNLRYDEESDTIYTAGYTRSLEYLINLFHMYTNSDALLPENLRYWSSVVRIYNDDDLENIEARTILT
jgi:hypothetical protein